MQKMKLIFMGTPEFSVPALEALINAGHDVVAVYSQPPRPAGRGQALRKSPVHIKAEELGIEVRTPKTLKDTAIQKEMKNLNANATVVVAYGLLLPKAVLDICQCINIHASLLPRWRGAAPIQRAIEAGDKETGVTIMNMDEGLDTGEMLTKAKLTIGRMNAGELHDKLSEMGANLIVETIAKIQSGSIVAIKQPDGASYADKISKNEAKIDWNNNATKIERQIRAFNPFPGAYFEYNNEKIKILSADFKEKTTDHKNGEVIDNNLTISSQEGAITPKIVQRQGKKPMSAQDMLRGFNIPPGTVLT